jgi:hypothetical protein
MRRLALGGIALLLLCVASAYASSIGPDCGKGNCMGSVYTLSLTDKSIGEKTTTYYIQLDIDTKAYKGASTDSIHSVAIKVTDYDFTKFALDSFPIDLVSAPGGAKIWTVQAGGDDSAGCNGKGIGWFCSQDKATTVADGSAYLWIWALTLPNSESLLTDEFAASIKAEYDTKSGSKKSDGKNAGITSADITLNTEKVPEPNMIALLGLGIGGVSFLMWRWTK